MTDAPNTATNPQPPEPQSPVQLRIARVMWLVRVRWALAGGLLVLATAFLANPAVSWKPMAWMYGLGGLTCLINVLVWWQLRQYEQRPPADADSKIIGLTAALVMLDMLVWMVAMLQSGGMMNPLAAVLVFLCGVAASLLPIRKAWEVVGTGAFIFLALAFMQAMGTLLPTAAMFGMSATTSAGKVATLIAGVVVSAMMALTCLFTDSILKRLRSINRRLVEANLELEGLDLVKSRFLRVSSHQLRGPLAAMHSLLSAMESAGPVTPKQQELIGRIQSRSVEIMSQLDDMMRLSTIKEKAAETNWSHSIDAAVVLADIVSQFRDEAKARQISLECSSEGPAPVTAWEDALDMIFEHLLSNALRYTPAGGRVRVELSQDAEHVRLKVSDTGIGIPADQQDRLFSEFFRATNARQVCGGTGLGLSIVHAIVGRLGGEISIRSGEGQGTEVLVTLPREPSGAQAGAQGESKATGQSTGLAQAGEQMRTEYRTGT